MSFILDALKKSETERQRQSGPALFEVKVAPPRGRFAPWALGLGALLAINLIVVGWIALRGSSGRSASAAAQSISQQVTPQQVTPRQVTPRDDTPQQVAQQQVGQPLASQQTGQQSGRQTYDAAPAPEARGTDTRFGAQNGSPAAVSGAPANVASDPGASQPADAAGPSASADDLAPAVEPPRQGAHGAGEVVRATESGLPTYQDAAATPGANLPDLHLDLDAYSPQPDQSFVFLNMMKLHEGDSLPTGVRVEHILRDGVILSFHGTKFVLQTNP